MNRINREDMLELTRRMTLSRNSLSRIAGSYTDADGFSFGTFNTNFLKLSQSEKSKKLAIAKAIPFAATNEKLKRYRFGQAGIQKGGIRQLLTAMKQYELKNDALMETFYELAGEGYRTDRDYAILVYYGCYDIPLKASDKEELWESEEIYQYLICAFCPLEGEYEPGKPECGFLYPAFQDRSADSDYVDVFQADTDSPHSELLKFLGVDIK